MDGIFLVGSNGRVVEWNPAQARITGISRDAVVGQMASDVWTSLLPEKMKESLPKAYLKRRIQVFLRSGKLPDHWVNSEIEIERPDGEIRVLESRLFSIDDESGPMAASICRDITENKKMDEALRQSQRFESLGVLAAGTAHDFNNLLVAMLGQSSLALAKLPPAHLAVPHLKKVVEATENAAKLVQQMLAISGQGQFESQPVHLNQLIEERLGLLKEVIPFNIELFLELADDLPYIEADPDEIQQVITNLIVNAVEAIGHGVGEIRISTAVKTLTDEEIQSHRYIGAPLQAGRYVQMTIVDNGAGMDSETLSKIFDPFFSTKNIGRGLGLPAAAGIMRGHHGAIWVDSTLSECTILSLLFPEGGVSLSDGQDVESVSEDMSKSTPLLATHVLVIDDQETVCEAVEDILSLEDIPVVMAFSGQAGIDLYRERQDEIGLVLLDLSMPGIDGYDTYQGLTQINPAVKVIFSSGYDENEVMQRFDSAGLVGFLKKPYNLSKLIQTVKQHMGL